MGHMASVPMSALSSVQSYAIGSSAGCGKHKDICFMVQAVRQEYLNFTS